MRPLSGEDVAGDACLASPGLAASSSSSRTDSGTVRPQPRRPRVLLAHVRGAVEMPLEQSSQARTAPSSRRAGPWRRSHASTRARARSRWPGSATSRPGSCRERRCRSTCSFPRASSAGAYRPVRAQSSTSPSAICWSCTPTASAAGSTSRRCDCSRPKSSRGPWWPRTARRPTTRLARSSGGAGEGVDRRGAMGDRDRNADPSPGRCRVLRGRGAGVRGSARVHVRRQWEVSIAVSELATNVLRHADEGTPDALARRRSAGEGRRRDCRPRPRGRGAAK